MTHKCFRAPLSRFAAYFYIQGFGGRHGTYKHQQVSDGLGLHLVRKLPVVKTQETSSVSWQKQKQGLCSEATALLCFLCQSFKMSQKKKNIRPQSHYHTKVLATQHTPLILFPQV